MGNGQYTLIQAIGFLAVLFFFMSFQVKTNKGLFIMQMLGCLTFSVQFALLGAFSGCLSQLINIARNIMLTRYNDSRIVRWKGWVVIFSALAVGVMLFTWSGWVSILPATGTVMGTIGSWTNNARKIRITNLLGSPCLLLYDALVGSWGGIINESIVMASILISIVRFGWGALDGDKVEK